MVEDGQFREPDLPDVDGADAAADVDPDDVWDDLVGHPHGEADDGPLARVGIRHDDDGLGERLVVQERLDLFDACRLDLVDHDLGRPMLPS